MSLKLSDKQREFLSAAAEREDGLLAIPPQLKGATAQKVGAKLVAAGLAKEVKAKSGGPVWRRDAETEQAYALKLTAAGLNAVGADARSQSETVGAAANAALPGNRPARRASRARSNAPTPVENAAAESRVDQDLVGASEPSWRSSNREPRRRQLPVPSTSASRPHSPTSTARCHSPSCARAAASEPPPSTSASPPLPPPAASASPTKVIASPVADRARATITPGTQPQSAARHRAGCPLPLPALSTAWRKR